MEDWQPSLYVGERLVGNFLHRTMIVILLLEVCPLLPDWPLCAPPGQLARQLVRGEPSGLFWLVAPRDCQPSKG